MTPQWRLTSSDLPTHLPRSFRFDQDRPEDVSIALNSPAANTVRLKDSYLVTPRQR